jgi:hypothetical protein
LLIESEENRLQWSGQLKRLDRTRILISVLKLKLKGKKCVRQPRKEDIKKSRNSLQDIEKE